MEGSSPGNTGSSTGSMEGSAKGCAKSGVKARAMKSTGAMSRTAPRAVPSQYSSQWLNQGDAVEGVGRCVTVEKNACRTISIVEGMRFATRQEATSHVKKFATAQGKQAVTDRKLSGGHGNVYVCSSRTPCTFMVRVLQSKSAMASDYFVSSFNADHNGCTGVAKVTAKQVIDMEQTRAVTDSNSHVIAKVLMSQVHQIEGVKVGQRMAYRARDAVVEASSGDYQRSCQELRSLLQNFEKGNPASRVAYEGDAEQRFKRAFLSHPNAPEMQAAGQRILGFDGAFMKTLHL